MCAKEEETADVRTLLIAGNWRENHGAAIRPVACGWHGVRPEVGQIPVCARRRLPAGCVPDELMRSWTGSPIGWARPEYALEPDGAFTGELSAAIALDSGCTHVILGIASGRHGFGETDVR